MATHSDYFYCTIWTAFPEEQGESQCGSFHLERVQQSENAKVSFRSHIFAIYRKGASNDFH